MAPIAYTGQGTDTVGPAFYTPNEDKVKQKVRIADFATTKIARKVFEPSKARENELPPKDNPGPGQYEPYKFNQGKNFNVKNQSSVFLSKVPNCNQKIKTKDVPGPGYYEKDY